MGASHPARHDRWFILLTGIDLQAGAVVDVIAEHHGTAECRPAFGKSPLNASKLAADQNR